MSWQCLICGVKFDTPAVCVAKENLDGENGWETRIDYLCPVCGEDYMEEITNEQDAE